MSNDANQQDLETNRQGRLAPRQYFTLLQYVLVSGIVFIVGSSIGVGMLYNLLNAVVKHAVENGTFTAPIFGGFGFYFAWIGVRSSRETFKDLFSGKVVFVDGSTSKHTDHTGRSRIRYYSVGKLAFQIPSPGKWDALPEGDSARAYYTPNSKTFVNVEIFSPKTRES